MIDPELVQFLSTPSARRATSPLSPSNSAASHFYPRPPRGGRPLAVKNSCVHEAISIHALREEGDKDNSASFLPGEGFLSTPSARRATCGRYQVRQRHFEFLSTPSARRATVQFAVIKSWGKIFLSTPSARRATILACGAALAVQISIHALREEGDCRERPIHCVVQ